MGKVEETIKRMIGHRAYLDTNVFVYFLGVCFLTGILTTLMLSGRSSKLLTQVKLSVLPAMPLLRKLWSNHTEPATLNLLLLSEDFSEPKDSFQCSRMTEKHSILRHNYEANVE